MTEKQIRDEAMRKVMWEVGHTNNDVTRYISDAVANQVVRDESGGWIPVTERLPSIFEYVAKNMKNITGGLRLPCRPIRWNITLGISMVTSGLTSAIGALMEM